MASVKKLKTRQTKDITKTKAGFKVKKKLYTISTLIFDNIQDIENQLLEWEEAGTLNMDSRVFEIKKEITWDLIRRVDIAIGN